MVGKHNDLKKITKIFIFAALVTIVFPDLISARPNWGLSLGNYKAYNYAPAKSR